MPFFGRKTAEATLIASLPVSLIIAIAPLPYGVESAAAKTAGAIQEKTAFLPDYAFADNETPVGTTVSGVVGSVMVAGVAVLICFAGGFFRKKKREA